MGLTQCPDCGGKLSTEATACPHCGRPTGEAANIPAKAPRKLSSKGGCLTVLAIVGGLFLFAIVNAPHSPRPTRTAGSTSAPEPTAPRVQLEISDWNWRHEHGYAIAEGLVTNVSNSRIKNVEAVVTFNDEGGEFIKSDSALIEYNPILPGQTSPWKVMSTWNPAMSKASLQFKTLFGGTIRAQSKQ